MIVCTSEQLKYLKQTYEYTEQYQEDAQLYSFTFGEHTITEKLPSMQGEGNEACKNWVDTIEFPA
jgi:hypothetical protein